jgi:hypothetical protein
MEVGKSWSEADWGKVTINPYLKTKRIAQVIECLPEK